MIQILKPEECCGCSACKCVCPKQAITMEPDVLGFLYPKIDANICVNCGLCEKVCAFNNHYKTPDIFPEPFAFGARHKNLAEVESSRSGAAFIALSDWILDGGGAVYGAGYKDHFRVVHKRATTKKDRDEFKGSKYVQSDLENVFIQIKKDLENDRLVLFSGTACQVAGLNSFVGEKYRKKLYLVDIVCHGVPSPYIWQDYLKYLEKQEKAPVTSVNFRDKEHFGWTAHKESFVFGHKTVYADSFTHLFYQHIMFRHSCGVCYFANLKRPSDITIADFWGWEKTNTSINSDDKGCSLIFCNTQKGLDLFKNSKKDIEYFPAKLADCLQPNLKHPSQIHKKRLNFEMDYKNRGFRYVLFRYGNKNPLYKFRLLLFFVKKLVRRFV